jgi:hypothetical protein
MSEHLGNQLSVIAKWDHVLKLYEPNNHSPFRELYKLTDTHLNPTAQVMSHTVAASLNSLVATLHCMLLIMFSCERSG